MEKKVKIHKNDIENPKNYMGVFERLRTDIQQTQLKAALSEIGRASCRERV